MKTRLFMLFALFALASMVVLGADVSGKYTAEGRGGTTQTLTLTQSGSSVSGTMDAGRGGPVEISNGKVDGDSVSFEVTRDMGDKGKFTTKYSLKAAGDTLTGTADTGRGPRDVTFKKAQ